MDLSLPAIADRPTLRYWLRGALALQILLAGGLAYWLAGRGWATLAAIAAALVASVLWCGFLAAAGFLAKWLHGDWPPATRGRHWPRTLWVESLCMLRAFGGDMPWRTAPRFDAGEPGRPPVLLVHGFLCNGAVWHPLAAVLREAGWSHAAPSLEPSYRHFAQQLDALDAAVAALAAASGQPRVLLVGHSMGGLLVRAYARRAPQHCAGIVMVAAPHHGTALGDLIHGVEHGPPSPRCRWLQSMNVEDDERPGVAALNLWSGDDNIVVPARSSRLCNARELALHGLGHMALITTPEACGVVLATLDGFLSAMEQAT